jgi:amidase
LKKSDPRRLRIAFTTRALDGEVDPECKAASEAAAKLCAKLGHRVEEGRPTLDEASFRTNFIMIWAAGLAMVVEFYAKTVGKTPAREDFEGLTWGFYQFGKAMTAAQYQLCWAGLQASSRQVARWQQPYDAWITPVLGQPPLEIGALNLEETDVMRRGLAPILSYVPFTWGQNVTGQPAISLPLARSKSGLPIGVQFVGRFGEEHLLLQLAAQIERAEPWSARPPVYG